MQNRMESNIRDKFLVKMIKLQEFTEKKRIAEMLNEMNPKLKALLAAGLIGTAGLGMQSCSNPSDSVYYPYTVEAPSTDNPGSGGGTENPNPSNPDKPNPNGDNEGEKGETVDFERDLGVNDTDAARIADSTTVVETVPETRFTNLKQKAKDLKQMAPEQETGVYLYRERGFQSVLDIKDMEDSAKLRNLIHYSRSNNHYYIPESMEKSFNNAIATYRASHSQ